MTKAEFEEKFSSAAIKFRDEFNDSGKLLNDIGKYTDENGNIELKQALSFVLTESFSLSINFFKDVLEGVLELDD